MFVVNEDLSIYATRGDIVFFTVSATDNGEKYTFQPGDVVRIKVFGKKDCERVVMQKDFPVTAASETVDIFLSETDTRIGEVISKPTDYWYEIELNPGDNPQTIIGYDDDGAKVFKLYPEGKDFESEDVTEADIPAVDTALDLTSKRPVQNQAIAKEIVALKAIAEQLGVRIDPADFGLGTSVLISMSKIDSYTKPGWFFSNESATIGGFTNSRWWLHVSAYSTGTTFATQELYTYYSGKGYKITRHKVNATWSEWEWVNPIMNLNTEYRTIERYGGKAVYTILVDFGNLPTAGGNRGLVSTHFKPTEVIRMHATTNYSGGTTLPCKIAGGLVIMFASGTSIVAEADADASAYTAQVQLWYTKD